MGRAGGGALLFGVCILAEALLEERVVGLQLGMLGCYLGLYNYGGLSNFDLA